MTALFSKLVDMSVSAGFVVLAVVVLRLLLRKAPNSLRCCLWVLVAVRLMCPVAFESALSVMPASEPISRETAVSPAPAPEDRAEATVQDTYVTSAVPSQLTEAPVEAAEWETNVDWLTVGSWVWLLGMVLMLLYAAFSYLRLWRRVRASIDLGNGVYLCDYICSPFILGLGKPRIYLPSDMDPADAPHVLAHEKAHIKRRDHWWKPLGFALLSVYWFHPLLWLAYCLLCRDIELACDERVIRDMDVPQKKAYSEALLKCSVPKSLITACPLAFGEVGVKQRVKSVLSYKKPGFWMVLAAALAAVIAAVCLLTDPETDTLSQFFQVSRESEASFDLWGSKGIAHLTSQTDVDAVWQVLDQVRYDPDPAAQRDDPAFAEEIGLGQYGVELDMGQERYCLWFSRDCGIVKFENPQRQEESSNFYTVKNPEALRSLLDEYIEPMARREATAEPFATIGEPWTWLQNVSLEAIGSAQTLSHVVSTSEEGVSRNTNRWTMLVSGCRELLDILNAIPEEALSGGEVRTQIDAYSLVTVKTGDPNLSIVLEDQANAMAAVIRYWQDGEDHLELILCREADTILMGVGQVSEARLWQITDGRLLEYMHGQLEAPSSITVTAGYWLDWSDTALSATQGFARIRLSRTLQDWEYETVQAQESFGIRCRPRNAEEGWLYFGFWPGGYESEDEDRYEDAVYANGLREVTGWPAAVRKENGDVDTSGYHFLYRKTEYPEGDYVILCDGTDTWSPEYAEQVDNQIVYSDFTYASDMEADALRSYGGVTVDFSRLMPIDTGLPEAPATCGWEALGNALGASELTVYDFRESGSLLFAAVAHGERHTIGIFREDGTLHSLAEAGETEDWGFRAEVTAEGMALTLCLTWDETVTGFACTGSASLLDRLTGQASGRVEYYALDRSPGLAVLEDAETVIPLRCTAFPANSSSGTLMDFLEDGDVISVLCQTNSGGVSMSSESALEGTLDLLKAVRYDPTPHSRATSADPYPTDEYGWLYPSIRLETETGETAFFFTYDCTQFWVRTEDGDTAFYDTADPPAVQEFLNKYVSAAARDTVTAEAFAAGDQPWQWLQGVSLEAVDAVWARWKKEEWYYQGCRMPEFRFKELLEVLHTVPESAVTDGGVYGDFDELSLYCDALAPDGEAPEVSLVIGDGANGLTAVLRCCSDHVELLLLDRELAAIDSHFEFSGSAQVWNIDSKPLLRALRDLRKHPDYYRLPGLGGGEGWVRELLAEVTWGEAAIRLPKRENWEYEIQKYTEQNGSMGIRCRPNGESGWLYFSFWPGGYHPAEENHYYTSRAGWTTGYNDTLASYPSPESEIWSYIRYSRDIGDFAIVNEGADRWMPEYEDEISVLELLVAFDGGQPVSVHIPDGQYTQSDDPLLGPWTYGFRSGAGYSGSFRISDGWLWDDSQEGLLSFWPREILRGKITLSWQDTPFIPEEGLTVEPISLSSGTYTAWTAKKEGARFWTCLWIDMGSGSILFRSYATDTWTDGQLQEVMDMIDAITLHSERLHAQDIRSEQRLRSAMDRIGAITRNRR